MSVLMLTALANLVVLFGGPLLLKLACSILLLCVLPGHVMAHLFGRIDPADKLGHGVLSLGIGYAVWALGGLLVHAMPGAITPGRIMVLWDVLILLPLLFSSLRTRAPTFGQPLSRTVLLQLLLVLVVASLFRFTSLGYAEFQDDEAKVVIKAVAAIQGEDDVIFLHRKGPVEILLPATLYVLTGQATEFILRLPFALANVIGLVALYLLAQKTWNWRVGISATLLLVINGYLIAFSRIVQYQSIVFLLTVLAVWCYSRADRKSDAGSAYPWLGALFLGVGLLAHYDAVFAAPVMLYWAVSTMRRNGWPLPRMVKALAGYGVLVLAIVGAYYIPLLRQSQVGATWAYLQDRTTGGQALLRNNLGDLFTMSTVYNSSYYVLATTGLLFVSLALLWRQVFFDGSPRGAIRPVMALVPIALALLVGLTAPSLALVLALMVTLVTAVPLVIDKIPVATRAVLLWWAVPFLFYSFFFASPRTHIYTTFPGWALLGGLALDRWAGSYRWRSALSVIGALSLAAVFLSSGYYAYLAFVQHNPEYMRTFPTHRNRYFWTPYGASRPQLMGWFGFPYQAGWRVIGALYQAGVLSGDYSSNEERFVTHWYTAGQVRCSYAPQYYLIAEDVQDEQSVPIEEIERDYQLVGRVLVGDEPKLSIYEKSRSSMQDVVTYQAEEYQAAFDTRLTRKRLDVGIAVPSAVGPNWRAKQATWGDDTTLLGYELADPFIEQGQAVRLTLYWRALEPITEERKVFVHIVREGLWAQQDHVPECGMAPTTAWQPGQTIVDPYSIRIDASVPAGTYTVWIGLYSATDGRRVTVTDGENDAQGDAISLGEVVVVPCATNTR